MVRLQEVAQAAQVSIGTASKILNTGTELDRLSPDCIRRVREAARALGYERNYHASALQAGRSRAVGVALLPGHKEHGFASGFWGPMVGGMEMGVRAAGCHFVIVGAAPELNEAQNGLRFLQESRIDALIVPGYVATALEAVPALESSDAAIVLTEHHAHTSLPVVNVDDSAGYREAARHLAELGHKHLLWVGPLSGRRGYAQRRRDALVQAAAHLGLTVTDLDVTAASGEKAAQVAAARARALAHFSSRPSCTAAVCFSEPIAFGVCAAAAALGVRIPADLSLVGFDDFSAELAFPAMTEISHMLVEMGQRAAELAVEMAGDRAAWDRLRGHRERIPSRLTIRESTGPARG
ncbi:MAG: LacI family DNA-binding transcriptional regulator [Kiritimatiellae bacterium]|nr:LacI family DNA-binding transcriptional regulator [Kiritimatiellia bacterium]